MSSSISVLPIKQVSETFSIELTKFAKTFIGREFDKFFQ